MTARWVVDEVQPHRDINITWQPISLLKKNDPPQDSEYYGPVSFTHNLLRVMEAIRKAEGDDVIQRYYWHFASLIHHDGNRDFDLADELEAAGFDRSYADAFGDEALDAEIDTRMSAGLALTGDDVGTPIISMDNDDGERVGIFGPVITRVPNPEQSLRLWDSVVGATTIPGFWELKRTRTESPEFGERPS